jgi:hypothetical protein
MSFIEQLREEAVENGINMGEMARERVALKRKFRRLGLNLPPDTPYETLKKLDEFLRGRK